MTQVNSFSPVRFSAGAGKRAALAKQAAELKQEADTYIAITTHSAREKAKTLYTQLLEIQQKLYKPSNPAYLETLSSLGLAFSLLNQPAEAERYYEKALETLKKSRSPNAMSLMKLQLLSGQASQAQRKWQQAKARFNDVITTQRDVFNDTVTGKMEVTAAIYGLIHIANQTQPARGN